MADDTPDAGLRLVLPARRAPLFAGLGWIARGWRLFRAAPLMWIISIVALLVVTIVVNLLPLLGSIAFGILNPVILAGFVAGCRSLERGEEFEIDHLLAGFSRRFGKLAVLGVILTVLQVAIFAAFGAIVGFQALAAMATNDRAAIEAALEGGALSFGLAFLVAMALWVPVLAAAWFSPALVYMHDVAPVRAMKASLVACVRNFFSTLVYGLVLMLLAIPAVIPLGLGMLVWVPVAIASSYAIYRDVFTEDEAAARPADPPASEAATAGSSW